MAAAANQLLRRRVLLVEDDAAVRRSTQLLLSSEGYDVRSYASGAGLARDPEALKASCLVADLLIPDGDALRLLDELRSAGWTGPAILISGYLTSEWAQRAVARGYAAALAKPVPDRVLKSWVARVLDGSSGSGGAS